MTVQQLKSKHKRERQNRKRKMVINTIGTIVLVAVMAVGVELFLRTWEQEMDIQTQKNIEWQTKYNNN